MFKMIVRLKKCDDRFSYRMSNLLVVGLSLLISLVAIGGNYWWPAGKFLWAGLGILPIFGLLILVGRQENGDQRISNWLIFWGFIVVLLTVWCTHLIPSQPIIV